MTPVEFLEQMVRPNIAEFMKDKGDLRLAYNAILSVNALVAHIHHARSEPTAKDDDKFRNSLAGENSNYALLRDAANAVKHVRLTRGSPQLSSVGQISAKPMVMADWRCLDEVPTLDAHHVVVEREHGEPRPVSELLAEAVEFLEGRMGLR